MTIARIWRGPTPKAKKDAYIAYLEKTGLAESAIARLRAWSAVADDAVERFVRRLLFPRRTPRRARRHLRPVETAP